MTYRVADLSPSKIQWFEVPLFKGDLGGSSHDLQLMSLVRGVNEADL